MLWTQISGRQATVKIHSILAQERRLNSAEWDLKSIFVHYNIFSKLLRIPKKTNVLQWLYLSFSGIWSDLDFVSVQFHLLLFLSPTSRHRSQNPATRSSSFSSSNINYHKLSVKLVSIAAFHFSSKKTDSSKAAFPEPQRNHCRAQNVI